MRKETNVREQGRGTRNEKDNYLTLHALRNLHRKGAARPAPTGAIFEIVRRTRLDGKFACVI